MSTCNTSRSDAPAPALAAGIDVGKAWLDAALASGMRFKRCANDAAGIASLIGQLRQAGVTRVGLEATGGYEERAAEGLRAAGLAVAVLQPLQVWGYCQFKLRKAKSDRLDAVMIAQCTAALGEPGAAPDPRLAPLAKHLTLIEQIEEDIARARVRLEHKDCPEAAAHHRAMIKTLTAARRSEIKGLSAKLAAHADLAEKLALAASIAGIGLRTALCLVIRMPELGHVSREQAASLAGCAPMARQSGAYEGEMHVQGGRQRVTTALFACAQAAVLHNPALKAFYARLKARGRHHSAAVMACARKLVVFANAVLARKTPWQTATPCPIA